MVTEDDALTEAVVAEGDDLDEASLAEKDPKNVLRRFKALWELYRVSQLDYWLRNPTPDFEFSVLGESTCCTTRAFKAITLGASDLAQP